MAKKKKLKDCEKCGARTALVKGSWYYEPDSEPYQNGVEEKSLVESGDLYLLGYMCDDCGHIQGIWTE